MSINEGNYRDILVDYLENQLSAAAREEVEQYMLLHEEAWEEYKLLKSLRLKPNLSIKMPNKAMLLKTEEDELVPAAAEELAEAEEAKVIPIRRMIWYMSSVAAVAALLIFAILTYKPTAKPSAGETAQVEVSTKDRVEHSPVSASSQTAQVKISQAPGISAVTKENIQPSQAKSKEVNPAVYKKINQPHKNDVLVADAVHKEEGSPVSAETQSSPANPNLLPEKLVPVIAKVQLVEQQKTLNPIPAKSIKLNQSIAGSVDKSVAVADTDNDGFNPLQSLYRMVKRSVKIEEKTVDGDKYYALSVETDKVKISKSFRTDF